MEASFFTIGGVAGEICAEEALFIEKAGGEHGKQRRDQQQSPERAEGKRSCEKKDERAEVHGMADEAVESAGDDLLVFFYPHCGCGMGVSSKDKKCNGHPGDNTEVAQEHQRNRNGGPAEAVIESR